MRPKFAIRGIILLSLGLGTVAIAVAQMPNPYGPPISLETAKKIVAPAIAEAAKNNWTIAVAVVDPGGNLVYYEKMDNTQLASAHIAVEKARDCRNVQAAHQGLSGRPGQRRGKPSYSRPARNCAAEGGFPLVVDGKIVGAIGASGMTSAQDAQCAKAGADSLK